MAEHMQAIALLVRVLVLSWLSNQAQMQSTSPSNKIRLWNFEIKTFSEYLNFGQGIRLR